MCEALERSWRATPDPKWVVAVGDLRFSVALYQLSGITPAHRAPELWLAPPIAGAGQTGLGATRKHQGDTAEDDDFRDHVCRHALIAGRHGGVQIRP